MAKMIKKIILDTDLGSDVDDVGAVALANIFHNKKIIKLLCVTHTTSSQTGPLIVEAINEFYGNKDIEVGVLKNRDFMREDPQNSYNFETVNSFPHQHKSVDEMLDATSILRKYLSSNKNVTFVCIGQLINLYNLLISKPDEYSSLNGEDLFSSSVKEIYIMGGNFPEITKIYNKNPSPEYNLYTAFKEAKYCLSHIKNKIIFIDGTLGLKVFNGNKCIEKYHDKHIVSYAYSRYIYRKKNGSRNSWDLITIYEAAIKNSLLSKYGPGDVELLDNGLTSFTKNKQGHCYVIKPKVSYRKISSTLEKFLCEER